MGEEVWSVEQRRLETNGVVLDVALAGGGPPVVLLHGFPHTSRVWEPVVPALAERHRVIAPDLRWLAPDGPAADGGDAATLARDVLGLLDALEVPHAAVVGIDAGTPVAVLLALQHPERVSRLIAMEALVGTLSGAEAFLAGGPPWWFGFHAVPGLAETVLAGHEAAYVDWFLETGTQGRGVPSGIREAVLEAYARPGVLAGALDYYRALPTSAGQLADAAGGRLRMPTMAIGAHPVGGALAGQLRHLTDDLVDHLIADCGHTVPLDRPEELLALLLPFLDAS